MKISEWINWMKEHSAEEWLGKEIKEETTRDRILYGDPDRECTGIVCTCFASIDVIRQAGEKGCNLIVAHESLFWNHGDRTDWLTDNTAFQEKKRLMDEYGICVWRFHDRIHGGIPADGMYRDGIFYGLASMLGWKQFESAGNPAFPQQFTIPEISVSEMAKFLTERFHLKGVRFIGNPECMIKNVYVPLHIMGRPSDNEIITKMNAENINCLLTMEMVDFTVCEYVRDAAMAGEEKCIFSIGHFNLEEIGMEYYASCLRENAPLGTEIYFVRSGDAYGYIPAE